MVTSWLGPKISKTVRLKARHRKPYRPRLEALEDRLAPAAHVWSGAAGDGLWGTTGNWSVGGAPGVAEAAVTLTFPAASVGIRALTNNVGVLADVTAFTIEDGGFSFGGAGITMTGAPIISDTSAPPLATNMISLPISMSATTTFDVARTLTVSGLISGVGGLTKRFQGTLALTAAETYTGATSVSGSGGTLKLVDGGTILTTSSITIGTATLQLDNNGLFNLADRIGDATPITLGPTSGEGTNFLQIIGVNGGATTETTGPITLTPASSALIRSTTGTGAGSNVLTLGGLSRTATGLNSQVTFDGAQTGGGTARPLSAAGPNQIKFSAGAPALVNGVIPFGVVLTAATVLGSGAVGNAGGFATLSGSNVVSATTSVNSINTSVAATHNLITTAAGGILTASRSASSVFLDGTGSATLLSGAFTLTTRSLGAGISQSVVYTTAAETTIDIDAAAPATFFVDQGSTLAVLGNIISTGGSGITKEGQGTATLSGAASTYTGTTTINMGVVTATTTSALGTSAGGTVVGAGTTLNIQGGSTIADALTLGSVGGVGGNLTFPSASNTVTGAISLAAFSFITSTTAATTQTLTGGISLGAFDARFQGAGNTTVTTTAITGAGGLGKLGSGTLTLSGVANTYDGFTSIAGGVLNIQHASSLGSTVGATRSFGFTLQVQGGIAVGNESLTVGGGGALVNVSGANSWAGPVGVIGSTTFASEAGTLTLSNNVQLQTSVTLTVVGAGDMVMDRASSVGGITKGDATTSTGTLTLAGASTYTGPTTVNAGNLRVNGSIVSAVTVNSGGTLSGSGITGAVTANSGGTVSPGTGPGILTASGNVALTAGSSFVVELNGATAGSGHDQLNVTGSTSSVSLGGTLSVSLGFTPAGQSFTIINNGGSSAVSGTFSGLPEGGIVVVGSTFFRITYQGGDGNDVVLTHTAAGLLPDPCDPTKTALIVNGTAGNDHIVFNPGSGPGTVQVLLNGVSQGTFSPTGRIIAFAGEGDDNVQVAGSISLAAWLRGEGGNDRLKGGAGHDVLLGGIGDDLLVGGDGRDIMIGGDGADRIVGNPDDDILIAGTTAHDGSDTALCAIVAEWTRTDRTYQQRVDALTNGGGLNGTTKLNNTTVFNDLFADVLTGSSGQDWFFFDSTRDRVTDLGDEAFANDLAFIVS